MPAWVWWLLLIANALAWLAFGWDKLAARRAWRRTSERTLLLFTFLGCVGAWFGMRFFRHKTRKPNFRWRAIALTVVNPLWWAIWRQFGG